MEKFKQFPKGIIKKNGNYYAWSGLFLFVALMGIIVIITEEFRGRNGSIIFTGKAAIVVGVLFVCFGLYAVYHLVFRAIPEEEKHINYHQLEEFKDVISGYKTSFEIKESALASTKSAVFVYYYILEIAFNKKINTIVNIKQRDRVEVFLWKIGLTRIFDLLTGNYYLDAKYRVKCEDKKLFRKIFNIDVIHLLEEFDRDFPPIRNLNGALEITADRMRYVEGPYGSDLRTLDPHRGNLETIFNEIVKIIKALERNI